MLKDFLLVQNSSSEKTDTGPSETDNTSLKTQKPVVTFISEDNLSSSNIFIDIADEMALVKFDTAPFDTDLFTLSSEKILILKGL